MTAQLLPFPDRPQFSPLSPDIGLYSQHPIATRWLKQTVGKKAQFACVLGFTETGLLPGISAAGATPADRQFTAIADAEFLMQGAQPAPTFPLPSLIAGASPVLISRAVIEALNIPTTLFNAGLLHPPTVPAIDLDGMPARCVSTGHALDRPVVERLLGTGQHWGNILAQRHPDHWVMLGECVVAEPRRLSGCCLDWAGRLAIASTAAIPPATMIKNGRSSPRVWLRPCSLPMPIRSR